MADVYKVLQPEKYLKDFTCRETRPDGRKFDTFRWATVNPGAITTADGSCIAKVGHTKVVCGIKAELITPVAENPGQGLVITNVELPPLCSSQFRPGPPGTLAQAASQMISDVILTSKPVNLESLCIARGHMAWVLYCDLLCVDYDGSIIDACILALITALKTVTLPTVEFNPDTAKCTVDEETRIPLQIHSFPVATTFTVFESNIMLADPTAEEERQCGGALGGTLVVSTETGVGVNRAGGVPLPPAALQRAITAAKQRRPDILKLVNAALQDR